MFGILIAIFAGVCFGFVFGYFVAGIAFSVKKIDEQLELVDEVVFNRRRHEKP